MRLDAMLLDKQHAGLTIEEDIVLAGVNITGTMGRDFMTLLSGKIRINDQHANR